MEATSRPHHLYLFRPPYTMLVPITGTSGLRRAGSDLAGFALVWCMGSAPDPDLTRSLRRRPGGLPLITVLPKVEEVGRPQDLFGHVDQCRPVSLLPFHESPDLIDLRTLLGTPPTDLPGAIVEYLGWRGLVLDADLRRTIRRILELSGEVRTVSGLARGLYMSRRALGRRFLREGLPVPSHWLQFGRILRVALDLQRPGATLMAVAFDHDFPDGFSLSNQMKRLLGLRPSDVGGKLGWEWIVERWLQAELATGGFRGDPIRLLGGVHRPGPPTREVTSEPQPA